MGGRCSAAASMANEKGKTCLRVVRTPYSTVLPPLYPWALTAPPRGLWGREKNKNPPGGCECAIFLWNSLHHHRRGSRGRARGGRRVGRPDTSSTERGTEWPSSPSIRMGPRHCRPHINEHGCARILLRSISMHA